MDLQEPTSLLTYLEMLVGPIGRKPSPSKRLTFEDSQLSALGTAQLQGLRNVAASYPHADGILRSEETQQRMPKMGLRFWDRVWEQTTSKGG